ncbi:LADA_0G13300g1_1 [Lachancea dasiensis]|uniref:Kinesin-like protein n=1 Tax=Lachancea dasiensis TaxID=1072105 RepID=A0A1G4JVR7_9SACH|nr:LADA_0G13300g1_1 [Lachancea dasiensis]
MSDNIKVALRLRRPLGLESVDSVIARVGTEEKGNTIDIRHSKKVEVKSFQFDHCSTYSEDVGRDQKEIYEQLAREYLLHALDGYNTCIFAYGQTGSGKSHTMSGSAEYPGIIPRLCQELFAVRELYQASDGQTSTHFRIRCSYVEIYKETVQDLLGKGKCRVREKADRTTYVEGLQDFEVFTEQELSHYFNLGNMRRVIGATQVNEQSSRSHAIFSIDIEQQETSPLGHTSKRKSSIKLIDLAGSERVQASKTTGEHLKEGANINRSLSALGRVISMLSKVKKPISIPYRDSVLTWVLKESLGGNSKTCMIACVSPCDYEETMSTIRYATLARNVRNSAMLNSHEISNGKEQVQAMRSQLEELQKTLSRVENQREVEDQMEKIKLTNQFLEARIDEEQKLAANYYHEWVEMSAQRDGLMQLLGGIVRSTQDVQYSQLRTLLKQLKDHSWEVGQKIELYHSEATECIKRSQE